MIKTYKLNQQEKANIENGIKSILEGNGEILFAYIYGSFACQSTFRDIDVALFIEEIEKEKITDYIIMTSIELEKVVGFPIDVRCLNHAPIDFQYNVVSGKVLLSRSEEVRVSFVERVVSRYLDMASMVRYYLKEAMT